MDHLLKTLLPKVSCAESGPLASDSDDAFMPMMDLDTMASGGATDEFKSAMEFRNMAGRRPLFSTEMDKIEGFRFSVTTPISSTFMLQNKWSLLPQQNKNKQANAMEMMSMMPERTSHYELDMYYIHGAPTDQMQMLSGNFDQSRITHFRGGVKANGVVEAMVMKKLNSWADLRFEGQFMTPEQAQWNLTMVTSSRPSSPRQAQR